MVLAVRALGLWTRSNSFAPARSGFHPTLVRCDSMSYAMLTVHRAAAYTSGRGNHKPYKTSGRSCYTLRKHGRFYSKHFGSTSLLQLLLHSYLHSSSSSLAPVPTRTAAISSPRFHSFFTGAVVLSLPSKRWSRAVLLSRSLPLP